jgi:hypothetical protein
MVTANEQIKKMEEEGKLSRLAQVHEGFIHRHRPKDAEQARIFDGDLNYLVHMIYREAQEPLVRQMTDYVSLVNAPVFLKASPTLPEGNANPSTRNT